MIWGDLQEKAIEFKSQNERKANLLENPSTSHFIKAIKNETVFDKVDE